MGLLGVKPREVWDSRRFSCQASPHSASGSSSDCSSVSYRLWAPMAASAPGKSRFSVSLPSRFQAGGLPYALNPPMDLRKAVDFQFVQVFFL